MPLLHARVKHTCLLVCKHLSVAADAYFIRRHDHTECLALLDSPRCVVGVGDAHQPKVDANDVTLWVFRPRVPRVVGRRAGQFVPRTGAVDHNGSQVAPL